MAYRLLFLTILLFGCLLGGHSAIVPIAIFIMPSIAQAQTLQTIVPADLPSRFDPAPPFLQKLILSSIMTLLPDLKQGGIIFEEASTFMDLEQAEIVMGLTANLLTPVVIKKFDTGLRSPDTQQIFIDGLRKSLSSFGKVEITQVRELRGVNKLGQVAKGFAIEAKLSERGFTLSTESIAFRRGNKGVLVIMGALDHPLTGIRAIDIALRLDRRLMGK
jgi:hypothetical protein